METKKPAIDEVIVPKDPIFRDKRPQRIITGAPDIVRLPKAIKPEDITIDSLRSLSSESFALWCMSSGVTIDGNTIDLNRHRYLLPLYLDSSSDVLVWQKAAQMGATVYMLLRMVFWLMNHQGKSGALYFPTRDGADLLSSARLGPMINSVPALVELMGESGGGPRDRNSLRRIGSSLFYIFHLGGKASKDSTPLDYISFDEVRLCRPQDIDQALERISHSSHKMRVFMSTAGLPSMDIAQRFENGTQHIWVSKCHCAEGIDLARSFPECIVPDDPRRDKPYLICPKCRSEIKDPQNGRYVARNPKGDYLSYHVSQLASKFISTEEIWNFYKRTTNMPEFYNSKLGLPYVDEENLPITDEILANSVSDSFTWAKPGECSRTAMGVDQMGQYNYVIIADLDPEGRYKRIRHLEIIESDNPEYMEAGKKVSPFKRLYELMDEYNVRVCVIDAMPNTNEAMDFARAFPTRVFIGWYQQGAKDIVQWGDRPTIKVSLRKAGPLLKYKYHAIMGRYVAIDFALNEFVQGDVKTPPPKDLMQFVRSDETGLFHSEYICETRLYKHLKSIVRDKHVVNEETGEFKMQWLPISCDPHTLHAWTYCNIALERLRRAPTLSFA